MVGWVTLRSDSRFRVFQNLRYFLGVPLVMGIILSASGLQYPYIAAS